MYVKNKSSSPQIINYQREGKPLSLILNAGEITKKSLGEEITKSGDFLKLKNSKMLKEISPPKTDKTEKSTKDKVVEKTNSKKEGGQ